MPTHYLRILTSFGFPKGSKTPQKWPFCHFLDTQEAVLGDLIFGGVNGKKIHKLHLGWKVDRQSFPTSYPALNLDSGKALKINLKVARHIEISGAAHWEFWPSFHSVT